MAVGRVHAFHANWGSTQPINYVLHSLPPQTHFATQEEVDTRRSHQVTTSDTMQQFNDATKFMLGLALSMFENNITTRPLSKMEAEWAASQALKLGTLPEEITRRGTDAEHGSTLDLVWHNCAAVTSLTLSPPITDWEASIGSDHVGIHTVWLLDRFFHGLKPVVHTKYLFNAQENEDELKAWWASIEAGLPILTPINNPIAIKHMAEAVQSALITACETHLQKSLPPKARSNQWWNEDCAATVLALQNLPPGNSDEKRAASRDLKRITKKAKCGYYNKVISTRNIWEVAKWRHGRCLDSIPALRLASGALSFDQREIANTLGKKFFVEGLKDIRMVQDTDPTPWPTHTLEPIVEEEITHLLALCANNSTPEDSGISWLILKHA
ncbi:hypothetical protein BJY52DRAFT_1189951 [Lactarius psammicola]|nr:hypothetical protein BJY52DRAFT_1189951 [Lactarius psammicola]